MVQKNKLCNAKQPSKLAIKCYLVFGCFDRKIVVFQQTVVRGYYILKSQQHYIKEKSFNTENTFLILQVCFEVVCLMANYS